MGCVCSKEALVKEFPRKCRAKKKEMRNFLEKGNPRVETDGCAIEAKTEVQGNIDGHMNAMNKEVKPSKNNQSKDYGVSRITSIPNGGEVACWPAWLTTAAGDVTIGWVPRRADTFEKLEKIGQGTYSTVYKARDLESGKYVAMKKVRFVNMDPESVRFMAREINILRKLDHPNVIKLESIVTSRLSSSLYLVFEYMDHDLAGLAARRGVKFTESEIKCYMKQIFHGLEHCHSRGVLHRDIKGSNLLIDNDGNLKIGDFGLASFYDHNQKKPLTSRVVTLWYRPPELLLGSINYGVAVDLWSSGCILAELFHGKPIMPGRTEVEQLHKIFKLCGSPSEEYWQKSRLTNAKMFKTQRPYSRHLTEVFNNFPASALTLLDVLLHLEPECRGSASSALESVFFTTEPLPCDPSNLSKYPPSKELDARLRNEEARRQRAAAKGLEQEHMEKVGQKPRGALMSDANPESKLPFKRHYRLSQNDSAISGFLIEPARGLSQNDITCSLQLLASKSLSHSWKTPERREDETLTQPGLTSQFHSMRRFFTFSRFASSVGLASGAEVKEKHDVIDHIPDGDILLVKQGEPDHINEHGRTYKKLYGMVSKCFTCMSCTCLCRRTDSKRVKTIVVCTAEEPKSAFDTRQSKGT